MGLADRDYYREPPPRSGFLANLTPVVKAILIVNIAVFILDYYVLAPATGYYVLGSYGAFTITQGLLGFELWRFVTFQFLHGGLMHILFNSVALYFFGPWLERYFGPKRFLIFYLLCGVAGAVFYTLISYIGILPFMPNTPLIGASAGIYGILIGVAYIAPNLRVRLLFPPIELSMRQLAIALVCIGVVFVLFKLDNAGGEAGHLGGAILGYFLMRSGILKPGTSISIHRPRAFNQQTESKLRPRTRVDINETNEVDAILDKVSKEGFQSLTDAEKETLKRAAQRQNP